ncbi:MAG TPA: zf-HC2 domain-containing protein [Gemmatimonadaceae bacterium]|nr:zf-HC2 domain-containing protein [Gemmatimonadaceae bacterium]
MQHLDEGTIHAWLDGELPAADQAQAERHVGECAECATALAEARGLIAGATRIVSALDVVPAGVVPLPSQKGKGAVPGSMWRTLRLTPSRAALAASVLIAVSAVFSFRRNVSDDRASAAPASKTSATGASVAAVTSEPTAPAQASPAPPPASARQPAAVDASSASPRPATPRKLADARSALDSVSAKAELPVAMNAARATGAVAGVAADSRPEPQRTMNDSAQAKKTAVAAADRVAAGGAAVGPPAVAAASRNQFQRAATPVQLQEMVVTSAASASDIVGCYQIKAESGAVARLLPDRFALERSTVVAAPNVVRAVTSDWRKDSVITGSNWIPLANNGAKIQSTDGAKRQVVNLHLTSLVSGQATITGAAAPLAVTRMACLP